MIHKNHHHKTNYETDLQKDQYISKIAQANYYIRIYQLIYQGISLNISNVHQQYTLLHNRPCITNAFQVKHTISMRIKYLT